ncbi:MAG TPA: GNAT family N-acetyltransferase, partial [Runella sp.]|nr:GNAT family N-acetyltransferase [Runella sp.]
GKGIITEAVLEVTDYAFRTFALHRLYAGVMAHNPASMKVLEKAGYHLEAILKKSIYKENTFIDEHLYVRFREG